ncbi:hypothetical protein [Streptomyces monomycini]|uniref:hypothetical protein n=1 Tax=Streptomyces monomycini TaxID=371720 RepID=UPI001EEC154D|nr:hypothetical protein [Streptomyces monomycini]
METSDYAGRVGLDDVKACFTKGDIEACVWTLIGALPWGRAFQAIKEAPAIAKAIYRTVTGIGAFIEKSDKAKKLIAKPTRYSKSSARRLAPRKGRKTASRRKLRC